MLQGIIIGIVIYIGLYAAKKQLKKLENRVHGCICNCSGGVCELAG
jgi:hypothetical protein